MYIFLVAANIGAWVWAVAAFHNHPVLLGTALLAYSFGLRHAVDADHIAAIDNVTRKLMQRSKRPIAVGFFFSIGHSLVVVVGVGRDCPDDRGPGGRLRDFNVMRDRQDPRLGIVPAVDRRHEFADRCAAMYRTFRHVRAGGRYVEEDFDMLLNQRGVLARLFRPLFRLVEKSWHIVPLGSCSGWASTR